VLAGAPAVAHAQTAAAVGSESGASVAKTGWWWQANQNPTESQLPVPVAPPPPSAPHVPPGALPVAAAGGEPEKISAIRFSIDAAPGSTVDSFSLVLQQSKEQGANVDLEAAKVVACPVTDSFWASGEAAPWDGRPEFDCKLGKVAGERADGGVWRFDLTPIARERVAATGQPAFSVVLVEDVEAPAAFQVSYVGDEEGGIGVDASTTPGKGGAGADDDLFADGAGRDSSSGSSGAPGTGSSSTGMFTGASGGSGGGISDTGVAAPPIDPLVSDIAATPAGGDPGAPTVAPVAAAPVAVSAQAGPLPWYSGIPRVGFLLVPLTLVLAYLAMLALGPDAQPAVASSQHGVGRALQKMRLVGAQALARGNR
jgi:hypothetical protein